MLNTGIIKMINSIIESEALKPNAKVILLYWWMNPDIMNHKKCPGLSLIAFNKGRRELFAHNIIKKSHDRIYFRATEDWIL